MVSPKLLLVLMVVAASMAAPQINERQVVGDVISQLQPAIVEALASLNLGASSSSFPSRSTSAVSAPRFIPTPPASPSRSFSGASGASRDAFSSSLSSSSASSTSSSSSSSSVASLTSSVVSSLQPSIAAAVAQALAGGRKAGSSRIGLATGATAEPDNGPTQYDFSYKVSDDEKQTYISQQESRDGHDVTGSYNFIDSTGALVTVNYQAGPEGYTETRDVEKGAVVMREIPGPWTGPLAGVDDAQTTSAAIAARKPSGGLSQSDLITQILAAIQPKIDSTVQSAISSSSSFTGSTTKASGLVQNSFASTRSTGSSSSSGQNNIINSVISSLGPRINSAVSSVISSSRTAAAPTARTSVPVLPRSQGAANDNLVGVFGVEGSSVKVETPEFNFEF